MSHATLYQIQNLFNIETAAIQSETMKQVEYHHIEAKWVCAAMKGMVFKQFSLG